MALAVSGRDAVAGFTDVTGSSGIFGDEPTWGAQAIDIDRDGDVDVVNAHHYLSVWIFTNDGTGSFTHTGIPQIVSDVEDRHGFLWADLDGDEYLDAVCSHGGDGGCACSDDGNELWRSLGGGLLDSIPGAGGMADTVGRGRCFSAADVDGDGDLDLYHAKAPLGMSPNSLYRNDGSMSFTDVANDWGVDEGYGTVGGLFADYDDDGDPDLLVGGEEFSRPTILWRNDGSGFTDVTAAAFDSLPIVAGADWDDFDSDGDMDLAVCEGHEGIWDARGVEGNDFWFFAHHRLNDDGVDAFELDTAAASPLALLQWRGSFIPDRFFLGPDGVHPNNPVTVLTDEYVGAPPFTPGEDEGLYLWRESAGGRWQIRVSAPPGTAGNYSGRIYGSGIPYAGDSNLEQPAYPPGALRVYRNDGGVFSEITDSLGLTTSTNPRHVNWVDFDNDGDLDLHLVNKGTSETFNEPDILWRNDGAAFVPLEGAGWIPGDTDHLGDGGVWADLDEDGDLDLFLQDGAGPNFYSIQAPSTVYRNDGPAGHWLSVRLGETVHGGTYVGSRVACHAGSTVVHRRAEASPWRGFQGPLALHFGLGDRTAVDSVVVTWPGGSMEVFGPFPADTSVVLESNATDAPTPTRPEGSLVGTVTPQPARGLQELRLVLPAGSRIGVRVFDVAGRHVRTLPELHGTGSEIRILWDGRDGSGRRVPAGIYFLRADGDLSFVRKSVRLR